MRALKLFLAVSGFTTYFIGMITVSALATSVVHSTFHPRSIGTVVSIN